MGKAIVYEHLGAGKYSINYTPDIGELTTRIEALEAQKTALDAQLYSTNGLIEGREAAQTVYDNATDDFNNALNAWAACASTLPPCQDQAALMATVMQRGTARAEAGVALNTIKSLIAENRSQYYATTQEIAFLNNTKNGSGGGLIEAWSIDYDEDVIIPPSTVVGTVETYGAKGGYAGGFLPRKWVNIQTSVSPMYLAERDNCVKPLSGIKTAAMFFNWCQWLYVMANNPQYAVGVVQTKFDPDQTYLDVELFGGTPGASMPAGYPFVTGEYSVMLLNVPVNYLTCGAGAFEAGDDVIVRFSGINRSEPQVIGFAENPRVCLPACHQDWPYHGVVRNGFLTLPNGTARVVGQPTSGDVITCQIPDHTAPERTEAEQIADTAAGMIWHDYKTFAGDSRIYNQSCSLGSINNWVWAPEGDTHWHAALDPVGSIQTVSGVTTAYVYITLTEPNLLTDASPAATEHEITITQVLSGVWTDSFDSASVTSILRVIDVSSDGSMVLLAAQRRSLSHKACQRGFFLLTLTSTSTATLTVLADHETCNPSVLDTEIYGDPPSGEYPGTSSYFGYADVPVWMFFNAADEVDFVYLNISTVVGSGVIGADDDSATLTLSLNGDVVSTYTTTWGAAKVLDGQTLPCTNSCGGHLLGYSPTGSIIYIPDVQYNIRHWTTCCTDIFGPPEGGIEIALDVFVYSNKSVGFRLELTHNTLSEDETEYVVDFVDYYYGNIIHPAGPTDPGTWISNDGAAPFTLSTPPTGVVHSEPPADYTSYNLKTGQLIRNQTVPVCYL